MGVSIHFPKFTLDCGYFGFKALRDKIVKMVPHKRFQDAHEDFDNHMFMIGSAERKKFLEELNKKINDIDYLANEGSREEEKKQLAYINNFSWASDGDAKMSPRHAEAIWHYIQHATEDFKFGYAGRPNCATFQQFKQGIKDCVDAGKGFRWM